MPGGALASPSRYQSRGPQWHSAGAIPAPRTFTEWRRGQSTLGNSTCCVRTGGSRRCEHQGAKTGATEDNAARQLVRAAINRGSYPGDLDGVCWVYFERLFVVILGAAPGGFCYLTFQPSARSWNLQSNTAKLSRANRVCCEGSMSESGTIFKKLRRNERPMCGDCGREMWLESIRPAHLGLELRNYECRRCAARKTLLVDPPWRQAPSLGSE